MTLQYGFIFTAGALEHRRSHQVVGGHSLTPPQELDPVTCPTPPNVHQELQPLPTLKGFLHPVFSSYPLTCPLILFSVLPGLYSTLSQASLASRSPPLLVEPSHQRPQATLC